MSITKYTIPLYHFSKPRGKLGKTRNIFHNDEKYLLWKQHFLTALQAKAFNLPKPFYRIGFGFHIKPKKGHKPDCDNMVGAILDALKEGKYITDDDYENIPRGLWNAVKAEEDKIIIFVMPSHDDFVLYAKNEQKLI